MRPDASSDNPSGGDRVVDKLLSLIRPIRLSLELSNDSRVIPEVYYGQSTTEAWTLLPDVPYLESATNIEWQEPCSLDEEVEAIVSLAAEEFIEDGMDSDTEVELGRFVGSYSAVGVRHLAKYLSSQYLKTRTVADIIRVLGRLEHEESHDDRFWIVAHFLLSETPLARDASAVALEDLGDPRAISKLEEAVEAESVPELRDDLQIALREIKKNVDAQVSQETR